MKMENYISIGKAAKYLGVSVNTLRVWEKKKILIYIRQTWRQGRKKAGGGH